VAMPISSLRSVSIHLHIAATTGVAKSGGEGGMSLMGFRPSIAAAVLWLGHDQANAEWIVIRRLLRGHNDTPFGCPAIWPFGHLAIWPFGHLGWPCSGLIWCF
jgi:hypothetical protein